ncbi:MAG: hypothetical protein ABWY93_12495 [Mycobacterium sp.]
MGPLRHLTIVTAVMAAAALPSPAVAVAEPGGDATATPAITTVPEVATPAGVTPFVDTPVLTESHPQHIDSWSRLPDGAALAVQFTTGSAQCYGVHAEVQETADIVAVKLRSGTLPEAEGRACMMIALFATLPVPLQAPLGNRAVVSIT